MTRLEAFAHLGVSADSGTLKQAKAAYIDMARTAHPDAGGTEEGFKRLMEAYEKVCEFLRQPTRCTECQGRGHKVEQHGFVTRRLTCHPCQGTGWVVQSED